MGRQKAELLRGLLLWSMIWFGLGVLLLAVYWVAWHSWILVAAMTVVGLFEIINLETFFRWRGYARDTEKRREVEYGRILRDNAVQVTEITASKVAVLAEHEDEGDLFVFDVEDGRLFWLHGQCVGPTMGRRAWPNDHFEIIRSLDGTVELGMKGLGKKIETIVELSHEEFASLSLPKDEIVAGSMDTIRDIFAYETGRTRLST